MDVSEEDFDQQETGDESQAAIVRRTGIALVHEGELVLPAAGSEAEAEQVADDARATVHYHFPVEIEVSATSPFVDPEKMVELVLSRLSAALRGA